MRRPRWAGKAGRMHPHDPRQHPQPIYVQQQPPSKSAEAAATSVWVIVALIAMPFAGLTVCCCSALFAGGRFTRATDNR